MEVEITLYSVVCVRDFVVDSDTLLFTISANSRVFRYNDTSLRCVADASQRPTWPAGRVV